MKVIIITDEDIDNELLTDDEVKELAGLLIGKNQFELIRSFNRSSRYEFSGG